MKKILGLSLVAATVLVGTMNAADEAGLSGDVRAMMHHGGQSYGKKADSSATAVSVASNIVYSSEKKNGMKFNIGFSVQGNVLDIGVENGQNSADEQSIDDNFINNILNAEIDTNAGTLIVGRQILDTPMAGPDDSRLVPDTFEAMTLVNTTAVADVTLIASQVTAMAGWDSPSLSTYTSMTSQLGTATEANGVTVLAAIYGKDALSASIYSYNIFNTTDTSGTTELNPISLNYLDAGYALDMGGMKINLAGQFEFLSATQTSSTAGVKDVDLGYTVFGAQADLALDMGLTLTGAFNSVTANDDFDRDTTGVEPLFNPILHANWGGYPEYAMADEFWTSSFNNAEFTVMKLGAGYAMGDLEVGAAVVIYSGDDKKGTMKGANILDLTASYKEYSFVLENQDIEMSAAGTDPDDNLVAKVYYTRPLLYSFRFG